MSKYRVDLANPKIDVVNGVSLPKEYTKELVKSGKLIPRNSEDSLSTYSCPRGPAYGPRAINGEVDVHVFAAKDSEHNPDQPFESETNYAMSKFEQYYGVDMDVAFIYGWWDASDVDSISAEELLKDLSDDVEAYMQTITMTLQG